MSVDKKTGGFKSTGEFLVAVRKYCDRVHPDSRLDRLVSKTMTEGTDGGGGFTVPEQWAGEILHAALEQALVRPRATPFKMTRDTLNVGVLVDSDRSSNIFGGITFTWIEETEDKAQYATDPVIGQLKLTAHEGIATCFVQNQLEDDYEDGNEKAFEDFMRLAFGRAIAFYEDDSYIHGSGSVMGQPLGVMNSGYTVQVTRTAGNLVDVADIGNMAKRLLPGSLKNAVWLINQSVLAQWVEMQSSAANSSSVIDLATMRCLGAPIIVSEHCAALGTTGDIILADFSGYVIGDRSLEISGSRHATYSSNSYGFLQNQTCWRMVLRVDGQPILTSPITPKRGASGETLSNFVVLTTSS